MKIITNKELMDIERQIFNKARDIDVAIFNALMDEESRDFVVDCLTMYVNKDGGFGNALHIDNYNTNSSVYQTYEALRIFDMCGIDSYSDNPLVEEIVNRIGNYLFNRNVLINGLWNPNVVTNEKFAHSLKYDYSNNFDAHPTAAILGYLLKLVKPNKVYYKKALSALNELTKYVNNVIDFSFDEFLSFNSLLGSLKELEINSDLCDLLESKLLNFGLNHINEEEFKVVTMLSNCTLSLELEERLNKELDDIIDGRKSHGLWENSCDWGTTKYAEFDSATLKWIGAESVNNIHLLLKYNRIEK